MRTEVFANADVVAYTELLAITDIGTLLHIDKSTTLCKQVLGTTIAQAIRHLTQDRYRGLG